MDTHDSLRLVDKPSGISSFDIIRRFRQHGEKRKMGHAGTLDPMASGLMILGVGNEGTKKLAELTKLDKTYTATIELGVRTDTGDREGNVVETVLLITPPTRDEVEQVLESMVGSIDLAVPVYSAVKVGGEPLYKKARRGEHVKPPIRSMQIDEIRLDSIRHTGDSIFVDVTMSVASGVFVRSVVEEIGRRLGCPATTAGLRRTRIGSFCVEDAEVVPE